MRIKRSSTFVVRLEGDQFVFHSYLAQQTFSTHPTALEIVRRLHSWVDRGALFEILPGYSRDSILRSIDQLIELGVIMTEGSEVADFDEAFTRSWVWGPLAAAYHFGARDGAYISAEDSVSMLRQQAMFSPSPRLFTTNPDPATAISLPPREDYPEPFLTMARRRTDRIMTDAPISIGQLSDCLLFSMAITAMIEDPDVVNLPLKMAPSGGARNPYEAYVCASRVTGLAPGSYHYSGLERTLAPTGVGAPPPFPDMLGGQQWTASSAAVIFLVANFDRVMWKYHDPAAYRVTYIEAGHIAQNIALVATKHGLVANPSGALSRRSVEETLGVGGVTQSVVYAIALGTPAEARVTTHA